MKAKAKRRLNRGRKGLTLVEIIIVLIIVVIVTVAFGASASMQVKRANRETVTNELSVMATNFTDAYYDLGNPIYSTDPADDATGNGPTSFRSFLTTIEDEYLNVRFEREDPDNASSAIKIDTPSDGVFHVKIAEPTDVYEQKYECWFFTGTANNRYVMVACGGDDGVISSSGYINVPDGAKIDYSDDIILVIRPKLLD